MLGPLNVDATPAIPPEVMPPAVPRPFAPATGFGLVSMLLMDCVAAFCAPKPLPAGLMPGAEIPPIGPARAPGVPGFWEPADCGAFCAACVGVNGTNCPLASTL